MVIQLAMNVVIKCLITPLRDAAPRLFFLVYEFFSHRQTVHVTTGDRCRHTRSLCTNYDALPEGVCSFLPKNDRSVHVFPQFPQIPVPCSLNPQMVMLPLQLL